MTGYPGVDEPGSGVGFDAEFERSVTIISAESDPLPMLFIAFFKFYVRIEDYQWARVTRHSSACDSSHGLPMRTL